MNLTDLQIELRSIENRISLLHSEIEKMKPRTEEEKKSDFDRITKLARKHPIIIDSIKEMSDVDKKYLIKSLTYLVLADESNMYSRLLYLTRISVGAGLEFTAEDIYASGLEFEINDIDKLCDELLEYKHTYLVEAFIMANISEIAPINMLGLIADIAKLMGCDKEEIRVIAKVAKAKLQEDLNVLLSIPFLSRTRWTNCFRDYISKEWIVSQRKQCGCICLERNNVTEEIERKLATIASTSMDMQKKIEMYIKNYPCNIIERIQAGKIVQKGDVILTYEEKEDIDGNSNICNVGIIYTRLYEIEKKKSQIKTVEKTITAPCDGIVYFIEDFKKGLNKNKKDKYLMVYIVSYFDDYNDFCKWYSKKNNEV